MDSNNNGGAAPPWVVGVPPPPLPPPSLPARKKAYATPEDWATHRDLITKLYWDEGRTLREVREFMQLNHGFDATEKMYKWRFKSWGLHKNLNRKDVTQIVHHAFGGKAAVLPVIRGRQVGPKKLRDYLCKMTVNWDAKGSPGPAAAIPWALGSPDPWSVSDEGGALSDMILFAQRCMENNCFGIQEVRWYDWNGDHGLDFWQDMQSAVANMSSSSSSSSPPPASPEIKSDDGCDSKAKPAYQADSFRLLDRAFSNYSNALDSGVWPVLVWTSIHAVMLLGRVGPPLAESFVRYASSLCAIKLGPSHAITRMWALIRSMSLAQFWRAAVAMLTAFFTAMQTGVQRQEELLRATVLTTARSLAAAGAMTYAAAAEVFQTIVDEFRDTRDTWERNEWYMWSRWFHAEAMFQMGQLEVAERGLVAIGPAMHGGCRDFVYERMHDRGPVTMYYTLRGRLHAARGEADLATSYFVGAYTLAKLRLGWNAKGRLRRTSSELREHYLRIGDVEAAEQTEREARAHWKALAGGVSSAQEADVVSVDEV